MTCIFCIQEQEPSVEHLIPESIGGHLCVKNVCRRCNGKLGTEADALLTRHRHIYDAYLEQMNQGGIDNLTFRFEDAYIKDEAERSLKMGKKNTDQKIVPTQIAENRFKVDQTDRKFVPGKMKRLAKDSGLPSEALAPLVQQYLDWMSDAKAGDIHRVDELGLTVRKGQVHIGRRTVMKATTPHRYVAKACVELAYGLGIDEEIENLDVIRQHAISGGKEHKLEFSEHLHPRAYPFHFLIFTDRQFQVCFFSKFAVSVDIQWRNDPKDGNFAYNLLTRNLCHCDVDRESQTQTVSDRVCALLSQ